MLSIQACQTIARARPEKSVRCYADCHVYQQAVVILVLMPKRSNVS